MRELKKKKEEFLEDMVGILHVYSESEYGKMFGVRDFRLFLKFRRSVLGPALVIFGEMCF